MMNSPLKITGLIQDNRAFKVHRKPRKELFLPHLDPDCPVNILSLKPDRTTLRKETKSGLIDSTIDRWDNYQNHEEQETGMGRGNCFPCRDLSEEPETVPF